MSRRTGGYNLKKKAGTIAGSSLISIEEIGLCRTEPENDIDLPVSKRHNYYKIKENQCTLNQFNFGLLTQQCIF